MKQVIETLTKFKANRCKIFMRCHKAKNGQKNRQFTRKTENDAEDFQCEEFSLGLMGPMAEEDWVMGSYISQ